MTLESTESTNSADYTDLLPDDLTAPPAPPAPAGPKKAAQPLKRTKKQQRAIEKRIEKNRQEQELALARTKKQQEAARLAQVVNLHIAGMSLAQIGVAIGATADEVDRMLQADAARYVRNQPQLRTYVRNWISEKYMKMIEADWEAASDKDHREKLEHQDRVDRFLRSMARLHGAEAPTQQEVKVEKAPEAVEKLVHALAAGQGLGYDDSIFDVVDAEVVEEASVETTLAIEVSGNAVEESDGDDEF